MNQKEFGSSVADEEIHHLSVLAGHGDTEAQISLGVCYYNGEGVSKDYKKAEYWLGKAAEKGIALAQYNLGELYYESDGDADFGDYSKEAFRLFHRAAEQGNADAMFRLANCYGLAFGTDCDLEKSSNWFRKAAELGNPFAQCAVAMEYAIDGNYEEAARWYRLAAEQGNEFSQRELDYYHRKGIIVDKRGRC